LKIILTISLLIINLFAIASTLEVGADKQFKTIKSAMVAAKDGDLILINKGIYAEGEILLEKAVTVRGIGFPVIDGKSNSQVIRVEANGVVLEGLDVRNAGYSSSYDWAAIKVINSKNVIIRYNHLSNNSAGVYLQNSSYTEVSNNQMQGNSTDEVESGNAIHCWKSDHLRILNNSLTNHRDGLYFEFVTASMIQNNTSFKNLRYGIHFMFSNDDTYIGNIFRSNGSGVAVMFSKNLIMRYNTFEENWGSAAYGILLKEIQGGAVDHNIFLKNTVGIYMEGTSRMMVSNNTFKSNGWAMRVQASCDNNTITQNNYFGNTFDVGTNGTMQLNKFSENYWDKYEGYDLNKDGYGDVHYQPVSLYSMIIEKMPAASLLLRSFLVTILDRAERVIPSITPVQLNDNKPLMKPLQL
jgi:nitrous oxidase accessory protein